MDGGTTQSIARLSHKYGLASKGVGTGGYDLLADTITYINSGDMGFTVDQQPYLQGFYPVVQLFLYRASGGLMFPSTIDTGLNLVTRSSVASYLAASRFEGTKA